MRGLNKTESDVLRGIALRHGYTAKRGPLVKDGQESGNAIELLLAIISGEVATVLLADEERQHAIRLLLSHEDEALRSIGEQLQWAAERENHLD